MSTKAPCAFCLGLRSLDHCDCGRQDLWDRLAAMRAERDAATRRAEDAEDNAEALLVRLATLLAGWEQTGRTMPTASMRYQNMAKQVRAQITPPAP